MARKRLFQKPLPLGARPIPVQQQTGESDTHSPPHAPPQLTTQTEGRSGTRQRQGAWDRGGWRCLHLDSESINLQESIVVEVYSGYKDGTISCGNKWIDK